MKILILGGSGMLGHQLWKHLHLRNEVWVTMRRSTADISTQEFFDERHVIGDVDAAECDHLADIIKRLKPDVVLNCIGLIKQLREASLPIPSIVINSLLPHRLSEICASCGSRLLLFSTDCVFSGRRGNYTESDISDAEDLYGRTKYLGEVIDQEHVLTLRMSIIGRGLGAPVSLLDWLLTQKLPTVFGYRRVFYSGLTTIELSRVIENLLINHQSLSGLWQVASEPISKYHLLVLLRDKLKLPIEIVPNDDIQSDRTLNQARFQTATHYRAPKWSQMIDDLVAQIQHR